LPERRLPRGVQRQGKVFAQAVLIAQTPKVHDRLDGCDDAGPPYAEWVMTHIEGIDVVERRKEPVCLHLYRQSVAFNLLFVAVALYHLSMVAAVHSGRGQVEEAATITKARRRNAGGAFLRKAVWWGAARAFAVAPGILGHLEGQGAVT